MIKGKIVGVCTSDRKGISKKNIGAALLETGSGLKGDAHAGPWHRQVSLLAKESLDKFQIRNPSASLGTRPKSEIGLGSFAENLTTEGLDLKNLPVGTELKVGQFVRLRITQIGKECHTKCAIGRKVGDCIMPVEGVFAEVLAGGTVKVDDAIAVISPADTTHQPDKTNR